MNTKILKGASILTAVLMVSMLFSTVLAGPVQPFNRWGYAYDNGGTPLDTQNIYAWIDGVSYGTDVTGTGGDVGLFSIDTYGDDTTPDGVKTGGYNGDAVFYTHGDLTTTGIFFAEGDTWTVGGFNVAAANLNEVAATPPLLKINNVASQANVPSGIDDYIVVYNPSGAAVDLTAYEISIGGGAAIPIVAGMVCPDSTNPVGAGMWCALDFTGLLSTTGNSITLAQSATGFIVDRVEYGAIGAEPENTMMNNAPNPGAGQEIYRVPAIGADTNDCLVDFTPGPAVDHGGAVAPFITVTDPFDTEANVPVNRNVVITFSEPMVPASVTYTCAPDPGGWVPGWSMGDTVLTLFHTDFAAATPHTFTVTGGTDVNDGLGLVAGPVPNPFTFTTAGGAGVSPTQIWVTKSGAGPDVIIDWIDGTAPWEIFISNNVDGSGFNFGAPVATGIMVMTWTHAGVLGDGNSYSYIVRGVGDATNSEIGWKYAYALQQPGNPNINWVSIPYVYQYTTLGQIGPDVGNAISWEIRCWDVANQQYRAILWNNMFMMWLGDTAYALAPGDAIMIFVTQAPGAWMPATNAIGP